MSISAAIYHRTEYVYDRLVTLSPQVVRLRPAPHTRVPITAYTLRVSPENHFINWQQDPQGNWQARLVFPEKVKRFQVEVELIARLDVFNPFDFFLEESAQTVPFAYADELETELAPFLKRRKCGPKFETWLRGISQSGQRTSDFLVEINARLNEHLRYEIRMEPGVQSPEETLTLKSGSCRDSAWLLVQLLRHLGIAARFVSGYLVQLKADQEALDGPSGTTQDFTDLHAWCEAYVPGAGWIGLDPTSGLFTGEGHIPLAATPEPSSAAPITGSVDDCKVSFEHEMKVSRVAETPRVTCPYDEDQWKAIDALGHKVDADIAASDMRLTMGGEPTFVSIDDMQGEEWNTAAVGPSKQKLAAKLAERLKQRFAPNGLLSFGQGKWYPGESLPRWAYNISWRSDLKPVCKDETSLQLVSEKSPDIEDAQKLMSKVAEALSVEADCILPAFEDPLVYMAEEAVLPPDIDVTDADIDDAEKRARLARVFSQPLSSPRGYVMPIQLWQAPAKPHWISARWKLRREKLYLTPGDSLIGLRLPLDSLTGGAAPRGPDPVRARDPSIAQPSLRDHYTVDAPTQGQQQQTPPDDEDSSDTPVVRTALAVEPLEDRLAIFMPPVRDADEYLSLVSTIEGCAESLALQVCIEGYPPPTDPRLQIIKLTPDPGVIEVNIHPAADWPSLRDNTLAIYEEARLCRLGTEKFMLDGKHAGTGGGNHIVVGAATPLDSPFLRRPDMLASVIRFWQRHPSLSYLFGGQFIGPTSQSPRVDEARDDALYELEIALAEVPEDAANTPPWLVDRIFRNLLTDLTGNTHRAELCIDKLYSPDSATGRLGLLEFRSFEMPPHAQMSLAQQLLVRALLTWFWKTPYRRPLKRWGNRLHDEMLLPHFLQKDLQDVLQDLRDAGYAFKDDWFLPHTEFRFPHYGNAQFGDMELELRGALEAWPTMGEEPAAGGTARYVDSSLERVQVKIRNFDPGRYVLACNGRRLPLEQTQVAGEWVAGVRFRAWQPWSCMHPTVKAHNPLTFDLIDTWSKRSVGGCEYHVDHPGGLSYEHFPINANEAESRRLSRFFNTGHTPGSAPVPPIELNEKHRVTLDLRRQPQEMS